MRPRIRLLVAASTSALLLLTPAAGQASPKHRPSNPGTADPGAPTGGTVPGLTGPDAARSLGAAATRFGQARAAGAGAANGSSAAAGMLHAGWAVIPDRDVDGAEATQSIDPTVKLSVAGDDTIYAPTLLAGGRTTCIEMTTIYYHRQVSVAAFDWCAGTPTFAKVAVADSTFLKTYTIVMGGNHQYAVKVIRTAAKRNVWAAYLFNRQTHRWDAFYTSRGTTKLGGPGTTHGNGTGWDMFEVYTHLDPRTHAGYYCTEARGTVWQSSNLRLWFAGTNSWRYATGSVTHRSPTSPSGTAFGCPRLRFGVVHANLNTRAALS